jgi:hypothetical protein
MKIPYIKKKTSANTEYRQLRPLDRKLILDKCQEVVDLDDALKKFNSPDSQTLNAPNAKMPRMTPPFGQGRNSARSMCEGTLDNFKIGTQYDLSSKTMDGLDEAFRVAHSVVDEFEEVDFHEVDSFPKTAPVIDTSNSTFNDLFNYYEIETITLRRKK